MQARSEKDGRRAALVTGASSGIGEAVALELARRGWGVILVARRRERLEALAERIASGGGRARAVPQDLADRDAGARLAEAAEAAAGELGPLELVVNNAGIAESAPLLPRPGREPEVDPFERHLAVNFHGPRRLIEHLAPAMVARGRGALLQVASSAGLRGYAYVAAYCASKHALLGLSRAAALELAPKGVRVGAICPHYVRSPLLEASVARLVVSAGRSEEEARAFFAAQNPGGRLVEPEEVAAAVADLAEDPRTGQVLELDGAARIQVDAGFDPGSER